MEQTIQNSYLQIIVVGNITDYFVHYAINLLSHHGIGFIHCEDIYKAMGKLVKKSYENVLVIGRLEKLGIEKGQFFSKMKEKGFRCCCLVENKFTAKLKYTTEVEVTVINELVQLEEKILDFSTNNRFEPAAKKSRNNNASNFNKGEFLTTKAEMDALLGS